MQGQLTSQTTSGSPRAAACASITWMGCALNDWPGLSPGGGWGANTTSNETGGQPLLLLLVVVVEAAAAPSRLEGLMCLGGEGAAALLSLLLTPTSSSGGMSGWRLPARRWSASMQSCAVVGVVGRVGD